MNANRSGTALLAGRVEEARDAQGETSERDTGRLITEMQKAIGEADAVIRSMDA